MTYSFRSRFRKSYYLFPPVNYCCVTNILAKITTHDYATWVGFSRDSLSLLHAVSAGMTPILIWDLDWARASKMTSLPCLASQLGWLKRLRVGSPVQQIGQGFKGMKIEALLSRLATLFFFFLSYN